MRPIRSLARAYAQAHPREVARLAETAAPAEAAAWLGSLPPDEAARVLGKMLPLAGAEALKALVTSAAASLLEELEPGAAATLLRRIDEPRLSEIVRELTPSAARRVKMLMTYDARQAASRVDPRAPTVAPEATVGDALANVRVAADGALNFVYVIGDDQRLVGVASMRELMLADRDTPMNRVMVENPYSIAATDPLDAVVRHPGWRKVSAMPVVDEARRFLGVIRYSQFRAIETELGKTLAGPRAGSTTAALAELFWLGTAAMAKMGETAILGRQHDPAESEP